MSEQGAGKDAAGGFAGLSSLVTKIPTEREKNPSAPKDESLLETSILKQATSSEPDTATTTIKSSSLEKRTGPSDYFIVVCVVLSVVGIIWGFSATNKTTQPPASAPLPDTADVGLDKRLERESRTETPALYPESRPVAGDGSRTLSVENIRWCLYQNRRMEVIRSYLDRSVTEHVSNFNSIISDFNARCAKYKYRASDMSLVAAEVTSKESVFQSQAKAIMYAWPNIESKAAPAQQRSPKPSGSSDSDTIIPPVVPPPATAEEIVPQRSVQSGAAPQLTDQEKVLDLLKIDDAKLVQSRLSDLGFLSGSSPNGIWTSRWRRALREFKSLNELPLDDVWDELARKRLFALNANKRTVGADVRNQPNNVQISESNYPPPPGSVLNPLNRGDAIVVQNRLAKLGFFAGKSDGVWGPTSRNALREFKTVSALPADDNWDAATESALNAEQAARAPYAFIGAWAEDVNDCRVSLAGGAPLNISMMQAEMGGVVCRFGPAQREGLGWRLKAVCTSSEKSWNSDVLLSVSNGLLTWSSSGEDLKFVRCGG